jgi:hypothetical protein
MRAMALLHKVMIDCESRQGVVEIHCFRGGREPVEDATAIYDDIDGGKPHPKSFVNRNGFLMRRQCRCLTPPEHLHPLDRSFATQCVDGIDGSRPQTRDQTSRNRRH